MKKHLLLLTVFAVLCACKEQNTPTYTGGDKQKQVSISFTYQLTAPFTYAFTNTSSGAESYKWDFGDGNFSYEDNVTHKYAATGTYTVTLTGTANGTKYDNRQKITVKQPEIYVAGYTLYKVPYENKYYKVVCKDDDWFGTDWGFTTTYTPLLDKTDLPYSQHFKSPLLMDKLDGDNYYTFYVYYTKNTSNTSGDTQCLKQKLNKSEIYTYKQEHILTSDNGQTQLGILMEYK